MERSCSSCPFNFTRICCQLSHRNDKGPNSDSAVQRGPGDTKEIQEQKILVREIFHQHHCVDESIIRQYVLRQELKEPQAEQLSFEY